MPIINALNHYNKISKDIYDFCKPLQDYLGIPLFLYFKLYYNNSRYIFLSNDSKLTNNFIINIPSVNIFFKDYLNVGNNYQELFWPETPANDGMEIFLNHGYWHGLTLMKKNEDSVELYDFLSFKDNPSINNFFIKHYKVLEKFSDYFNLKFIESKKFNEDNYLINFSEKCKFNLPSLKLPDDNNYNIENFLKRINFNTNNIKINGSLITVTQREKQCLELLARGYSLKSIGQMLLISPRTVETHLDKLKEKTGCTYKEALIGIYYDFIDKYNI